MFKYQSIPDTRFKIVFSFSLFNKFITPLKIIKVNFYRLNKRNLNLKWLHYFGTTDIKCDLTYNVAYNTIDVILSNTDVLMIMKWTYWC